MTTPSSPSPCLNGPDGFGLITIPSTHRDDPEPLDRTKRVLEMALDLETGALADKPVDAGKRGIEKRILDLTVDNAAPRARYAFDPTRRDLVVIPINWFTIITRTRANSKTPKAYNEAIHLLGYILYKYQRAGRIPGALLRLESDLLCERFGMSIYTLRSAMRYLGSEGFIYRVMFRGYVPWKPRKSRTYMYVVPRMSRIEQASRGATRGTGGVGTPPY